MPFTGRLIRDLLVQMAVFAAGIAYVYHPILLNGFDRISTDLWDGRIMIAMLEHWRNVVRLGEHPLNVLWFFPTRTAIAYNDALVFGGTVYAFFRLIGFDYFISYELTNFAIRLLGYAGMYLCARRVLGMRRPYAMLAGFVFLIVSNIAYRMSHGQLLYASFVPLGFFLFWSILGAIETRVRSGARFFDLRSHVYAASFGAYISIWALTAFYSLYVFCLLLVVWFVSFLLLSPEFRRRTALVAWRGSPFVVTGLLSIAAGVLIVLTIYRTADTPGHDVKVLQVFAGFYADLFNVGQGNLLWSDVIASIYRKAAGRPMASVSHELATGFDPVLVLLFLTSLTWIALRWTSAAERRRIGLSACAAFAIAAVVMSYYALQTAGEPHWSWAFQNVPGASVVRVPMRILLFVTPLIILVAVAGLDFASRGSDRGGAGFGVIAVAVLLIAGQYRVDLTFILNRADELNFMRQVTRPPEGCRYFFVSRPRFDPTGHPLIDQFYIHSVDAMLLSEVLRTPTINGIATFQPKGWDVHSPFAPDYPDRVKAYAQRNGLADGLCGLDLKQFTWTPLS